MVTGSSLPLVGSSDLPAGTISCINASPPEVTRIDTRTRMLFISGISGTTVAGPSQFPARVFTCLKAFCASDCGALDWAKASAKNLGSVTQEEIERGKPHGSSRFSIARHLKRFGRPMLIVLPALVMCLSVPTDHGICVLSSQGINSTVSASISAKHRLI